MILDHVHISLGEKKIDLLSEFGLPGLLEKTGIPYVYETKRSTADLAVEAASQMSPADLQTVELFILITQSPDDYLPANSISIANRLGLSESALCFDINQGCSGYVQMLCLVENLLIGHSSILLLTADRYRSKIKPGDRSTFAVFSDGATASLLSRSRRGILWQDHQTNGNKRDLLFQSTGEENDGFIHMAGAELWMFTRLVVVPQIKNALAFCTDQKLRLKNLYLHQASKVVVESIESLLDLPDGCVVKTYSRFGNTVSSSIPMTLHEYPIGELAKNEVVIFSGFGVGLTSSVAVYGSKST